MHGYQSTRGVWEQEMQNWMDEAPGDTIGIAFAGMGSEGTALGSGQWAITPRQYAFQTMEQLDQLGLYGKELTVIGHSMGGAAALEMGLTIDSMAAPGSGSPDVRYVMLAPATGPDSVPFLMHGIEATLIDIQNSLGTIPLEVTNQPTIGPDGRPMYSVPPSFWASLGNSLLGPTIVDGLVPGAPHQYIRDIHSGFANDYGFAALASQASGLLHQGYPDPAAVEAFMASHPVVVVAAEQDRLVDPRSVERVFGPTVLTVEGNHYAHLANIDHPEWGPLDGPPDGEIAGADSTATARPSSEAQADAERELGVALGDRRHPASTD